MLFGVSALVGSGSPVSGEAAARRSQRSMADRSNVWPSHVNTGTIARISAIVIGHRMKSPAMCCTPRRAVGRRAVGRRAASRRQHAAPALAAAPAPSTARRRPRSRSQAALSPPSGARRPAAEHRERSLLGVGARPPPPPRGRRRHGVGGRAQAREGSPAPPLPPRAGFLSFFFFFQTTPRRRARRASSPAIRVRHRDGRPTLPPSPRTRAAFAGGAAAGALSSNDARRSVKCEIRRRRGRRRRSRSRTVDRVRRHQRRHDAELARRRRHHHEMASRTPVLHVNVGARPHEHRHHRRAHAGVADERRGEAGGSRGCPSTPCRRRSTRRRGRCIPAAGRWRPGRRHGRRRRKASSDEHADAAPMSSVPDAPASRSRRRRRAATGDHAHVAEVCRYITRENSPPAAGSVQRPGGDETTIRRRRGSLGCMRAGRAMTRMQGGERAVSGREDVRDAGAAREPAARRGRTAAAASSAARWRAGPAGDVSLRCERGRRRRSAARSPRRSPPWSTAKPSRSHARQLDFLVEALRVVRKDGAPPSSPMSRQPRASPRRFEHERQPAGHAKPLRTRSRREHALLVERHRPPRRQKPRVERRRARRLELPGVVIVVGVGEREGAPPASTDDRASTAARGGCADAFAARITSA